MKNLALLVSLAAVSLSFSSCCSMFGLKDQHGHYRTETRQVKTCKYDIVTEQIVTPATSKGGMDTVEVIEKKVPRYKTVTKKVRVSGGSCVRLYCPTKDACGTTSDATRKLSSAQSSSGSPSIGLIPSIKPIAP